MIIEEMLIDDLDEVLGIENLSFVTPWSRQSFQHELENNPKAVYLVARERRRVIGYAGIWIILDEGHITNLAVHPDFRRQGVGRALLRELGKTARDKGAFRLTLEVRRSNLSAQKLYTEDGFVSAGIRRRYYRDNNEDALIMWKTNLPATT